MENRRDFKRLVDDIGSLNCLKEVMESYNIRFKKDSSGYVTNCVFHNDKTPSLRITEKCNKAIYHCFGCETTGDIINFISKMDNIDNIKALFKAYDILGRELPFNVKSTNNKLLSFENFIRKNNSTLKRESETYNLEDIYFYYDEYNHPLYCKVKYKSLEGKKYFLTKSLIETDRGFKYGETKDFDNCEKKLYNLPQVKKAISRDSWIFFVEGEKDVKTLKSINLTATTIYTKKWQNSYSEDLKNAKVAFIGDSGRAGEEFKNFVVENLKKCCKDLKIVRLPNLEDMGNNKDVTDWIENNNTREDLIKAVKNSLNILDKNNLQQDENGVYETIVRNEKEEKIEYKRYITNFQVKNVHIYRNVDNKEQIIKFHIISKQGIEDILEMDGRESFSDIRSFKKVLGFDYTFKGNTSDLTAFKEWISEYFTTSDVSVYNTTGIRKIDNENVLITNHGVLKKDGTFDIKTKAINNIHDIDFRNIEELSKEEADILAKYLFKFNSKKNVYNTLGLGVAHMLNSFVRNSSLDNLPILQDLGESKSGKSKALTILRLLYNNTQSAMSLSASTDFALLKSFNDSYLPVFLDEVKISKVSKHKINSLSNHIRAITEGYHNSKGNKNLSLTTYTYNASLIISGEEEMQETAVKNRSNIVWYAISNFTEEGQKSINYLCNSKEGQTNLRRLSKSLYLNVLNNYDEDYFDTNYLIIKNKYEFERKLTLNNSREVNTAVYTMMGLELLVNTLNDLGADMDEIIDLDEAADLIVENLQQNVLEENTTGSKSEYEKILEEINHLVAVEDSTIRIEENVHYKVMTSSNSIAFDFKTIYDKLNKYFKLYKSDMENLIDYKTFIKMISKSSYIIDSDSKKHYKAVKRKVLSVDDKGLSTYLWKNKKMFILKIDEVKKLEMDNIFEESFILKEVTDKVIPFS